MTQAGTADWTLGTATFWDGDHMQAALDDHRFDVYREQLTPIPRYVGGTVRFHDYASQYANFEKTQAGTAVFIVEDGVGNDQGTAGWSADYIRGRVTFTTNRKGTAYYLTGRIYDLNGAAADIWRAKADHYSGTHFDFSTDNMSVRRGQVVDHCLEMVSKYEAKQWANSFQVSRGDEV